METALILFMFLIAPTIAICFAGKKYANANPASLLMALSGYAIYTEMVMAALCIIYKMVFGPAMPLAWTFGAIMTIISIVLLPFWVKSRMKKQAEQTKE